jgi:hypothetical protein
MLLFQPIPHCPQSQQEVHHFHQCAWGVSVLDAHVDPDTAGTAGYGPTNPLSGDIRTAEDEYADHGQYESQPTPVIYFLIVSDLHYNLANFINTAARLISGSATSV